MVWFLVWRSLEVHALLYWIAAVLLSRTSAQYSSDQCNWRGSGLSHEGHRRDVEQIYLRCSQGLLEWLYPTGAIVVNLRPNTEPSPGAAAGLHVCIKSRPGSQGARVYLEQAGKLRLLLGETGEAPGARGRALGGRVVCFGAAEGVLFIEAVAQPDISRRITAFQYELVAGQVPGGHLYPYLHPSTAPCKPCSDEEVLMAACTSDFVGRGKLRRVPPSPPPSPPSPPSSPPSPPPSPPSPPSSAEEQASLAVELSALLRQRGRVFARAGPGRRAWTGSVRAPRLCGAVDPGPDDYLLTGSLHFGEAWLGCAPLYRDFVRLYRRAEERRSNPCTIHARSPDL